MWTVGLWPCYWKSKMKKSRVSPICLTQTLYCWGFFSFWQSVHWTCEKRWENPTNAKNMPYSAWRWGSWGAGNVQRHTAHIHIFWGGRYSCFCRCQIALKICCRAVIFESRGHLPFVRCCLPSVLFCLAIGQFLLADWNRVSVQRPRYLKSLS